MLLDVKPSVWRSVLVPSAITLPKLHLVIQGAMGWEDCHLHEFRIDGTRYGVRDPEWDELETVDERRVALHKVLEPSTTRCFEYLYDFGDNWHHLVYVDDLYPQSTSVLTSPQCLAGENACPPEDVGGFSGYADFVRAVQDPRDPEHGSCIEWCGGAFDPTQFGVATANRRLKQIKP